MKLLYSIQIFSFCCVTNISFAQQDLLNSYNQGIVYSLSINERNIKDLKMNPNATKTINCLTQIEYIEESNLSKEYVSEAYFFQLDKIALDNFYKDDIEVVKFKIPFESGKEINMVLKKFHIIDKDGIEVLLMPSNKTQTVKPTIKTYKGYIDGIDKSVVYMTFDSIHLNLTIRDENGNYQLVPIDKKGKYKIYNEFKLNEKGSLLCGVESHNSDDFHDEQLHNDSSIYSKISNSSLGCFEVNVVVDNAFYLNQTDINGNPSIEANLNEILFLYSDAATIFELENLTLRLNHITLWQSIDPYSTESNMDEILRDFTEDLEAGGYRNPNKNRVFQLVLGSDHYPYGGTAWLGGFGDHPDFDEFLFIDLKWSGPVSVLSSANNYNPLPYPNLSYRVRALCHEIGHNLGSHHTHACKWNGNNTAIDGCVPVEEGNCNRPPTTNNGTIMSYCSSINYTLGFGDQPGNVIRNTYLDKTNGNSQNRTCNCPDNILIEDGAFASMRANNTISIHSSIGIIGNTNVIAGEKITISGTGADPSVIIPLVNASPINFFVNQDACFMPPFEIK